jgi:phosphoribosylformylglycinamidine (FGAM) synthase PurS component
MQFTVTIEVYPKKDVLDFQARAIETILQEKRSQIKNCQTGKLFIYEDVGSLDQVHLTAQEFAKQILSSPVSEEYQIRVDKKSVSAL